MTSLFMLLPTELDPNTGGITWDNFNYTPVVMTMLVVMMCGHWNLPRPYGAKHFYKGPVSMESINAEEECLEIPDFRDNYGSFNKQKE